ncbi:iron-sulfur cluster assembly scaffold protein [Candidatus Nasuia deltocephalinicola]|uniref:iron-sulfur cluster assembly scaffold protein n=1 Tax=Candidatus Nasuia deltocephalincola TaxID=1160784 RepID=UPI00216B66BE|nr:iron-sulfur cluster assembly scaffold protein [Candidatus Nasuia deltocephalinicola]
MSYNNKILFLFKYNLYKNLNLFSNNSNNLGNNYIGSYSCGDIIYLQILYNYFNIFIFKLKYKVYGCGSAISSISLVFYYVFNKFYYQIFYLKNFHISNKLNLPILKFHCSVLVENIINLQFCIYKNSYIIYFL